MGMNANTSPITWTLTPPFSLALIIIFFSLKDFIYPRGFLKVSRQNRERRHRTYKTIHDRQYIMDRRVSSLIFLLILPLSCTCCCGNISSLGSIKCYLTKTHRGNIETVLRVLRNSRFYCRSEHQCLFTCSLFVLQLILTWNGGPPCGTEQDVGFPGDELLHQGISLARIPPARGDGNTR